MRSEPSRRPARTLVAGLLLLLAPLTGGAEPVPAGDGCSTAPGPVDVARLPAEFEPQEAIVLAAGRLTTSAPELLSRVLWAAAGNVKVVALASDDVDAGRIAEFLDEHGLAGVELTVARVAHDSLWVRDHGGLLVERRDGSVAWLDPVYSQHDRLHDDVVPVKLSAHFGVPAIELPLTLDGGHVISNGQGVIVSSLALLDENPAQSELGLEVLLADTFGADRVVLLEPLVGEDTGHVDMFTAFVSPDVVLVGRYDPEDDPENAALLDRNAARLATVRTGRGFLRVVRVPMPPRDGDVWRTHLNLVMANHVVLLPCYRDVARDTCDTTREILEQLLPDRSIVQIDTSEVEMLGGALHCLVLDVPDVPGLEKHPTPPADATVVHAGSGDRAHGA